jgi:hypothetical protein
MARNYTSEDFNNRSVVRRHNFVVLAIGVSLATGIFLVSPLATGLTPTMMVLICAIVPSILIFLGASVTGEHRWIEKERVAESLRRGGKPVLGGPPNRLAFDEAIDLMRANKKSMIDRYLVGFELDSGEPIWVSDDDLCSHAAVFAKTGVGKTLWLEGLMFQQMARGRASGLTFIDAKRDPGTLADIIMMALLTGRIEDVVVVDPFDPVCAYNFVFTTQRADVKARKVLRCGLPPTTDASTTKHYDRLAADAVYRVVRAMESLGLAWSVRDIAVALSAFTVAYPRMRELLHEQGAKQAMVELGHLAGSYRTAKGSLDAARLTDNLRGIASELHSIANSEAGEMFCVPRADLSLTDAILRGKIIYYMLPRLEEAESAARMVKVFREDLEVSIGEITSSRTHHLEDPHMVIIDEGASTFGPTWANLFELARKGRFALLFGAQSIGGLMDAAMGLSPEFYERVIANVNLKVIMRLGDNRTAEDMCEWIGMVNTQKTTIATGSSSSLNSRELTKHLEFNRRTADGYRDGFTFSEEEKELVSAEELKHEMSAEKGLAWFDKGDGRLRKGRSIWFDADLPSTWEGREYLVRYESVEADEIGLAEWVDEHILSVERAEHHRTHGGSSDSSSHSAPGSSSSSGGSSSAATKDSTPSGTGSADDANAESGGSFRINPLKGFRGMGRARVTVASAPAPQPAPTPVAATPAAAQAEPNTTATTSAKETAPKVTPTTVESAVPTPAAPAKESAPVETAKSKIETAAKPEPAPATSATEAKPEQKNTSAAGLKLGGGSSGVRRVGVPAPGKNGLNQGKSSNPPAAATPPPAPTPGAKQAPKNQETLTNAAPDPQEAASDSSKKKRKRRKRNKQQSVEEQSPALDVDKSAEEKSDRLVLRGSARDTVTNSTPGKIVH